MSLLEDAGLSFPENLHSFFESEEFGVSPADIVETSLHRKRAPGPRIGGLANLGRTWSREPWSVQFAMPEQLLHVLLEFSSRAPAKDLLVDDEPPLALGGRFSPSKALVDIWLESLSELGEAAELAAPPAKFDGKQDFSRHLEDLIGMNGQQRRYTRAADPRLTVKGRFTAEFQIKICDAFLIVPDRSALFLDQLKNDIVECLKSGAEISGAWGALKVTRDSNIQYLFAPVDRKRSSAFIESEEEDVRL